MFRKLKEDPGMSFTTVVWEGVVYYFYGSDSEEQAREFLASVR